nr:hypothetical protein Q903MT_gene5387 [Picea sitchensis]
MVPSLLQRLNILMLAFTCGMASTGMTRGITTIKEDMVMTIQIMTRIHASTIYSLCVSKT